MGLFAELLVFFCSGAALTAQCLFISSCNILDLNRASSGDARTGGYGLFFVDVPELESETCIKTMEIDDIFGRWGNDYAWEPREDDLLVGAQIGACLSLAFGFISFMNVFCKQCFFLLPCFQFVSDISGLAIQAGLAMVYLLWISEGCNFYDCEAGDGLWFVVAAQVLWMIASILSRCTRPSAAERKRLEAEEEEQVEKEQQQQEQQIQSREALEAMERDHEEEEEDEASYAEEEDPEAVYDEEVEEVEDDAEVVDDDDDDSNAHSEHDEPQQQQQQEGEYEQQHESGEALDAPAEGEHDRKQSF